MKMSGIRKTAKKTIDVLSSRAYLDYGRTFKSSVLLAGVGRSGTTWLSDVINHETDHRYIFEPFHPVEVHICRQLRDRQYIQSDCHNSQYSEIVGRVLAGEVDSFWSDRFNKRRIANKRLIKAIRANLFLRWIFMNFPDLPIVFLIRHPLAVAVSRLRYKHWRQKSLDIYLSQPDLVDDFLDPFREELERSERNFVTTNDPFENHIFSWCIENYVVLKQFSMGEIFILFYENCCITPEAEMKKLSSYLGYEYSPKVIDSLGTASKLSRKDSAIFTGKNLISGWRKHLRANQIDRAMEIISLFSLNSVYSQDAMPKVDNLPSLMNFHLDAEV